MKGHILLQWRKITWERRVTYCEWWWNKWKGLANLFSTFMSTVPGHWQLTFNSNSRIHLMPNPKFYLFLENFTNVHMICFDHIYFPHPSQLLLYLSCHGYAPHLCLLEIQGLRMQTCVLGTDPRPPQGRAVRALSCWANSAPLFVIFKKQSTESN